MSCQVISASWVAALLLTSAATAATVTNRDEQDHKITVIEGNIQSDHVVKGHAALEGICLKGCLIRLDGSEDDPYELEGSQMTSIEDGQLYDDELEASPEPSAGDGG